MRHGLEICCGGPSVTASLLVELGELAERAGWDGVFFEDYLIYYDGDDPPTYDPWLLLAAIAGRTSRIRLGTTVTSLPRRRPAKLAREVLTLDHLSAGRATVAVGVGDPKDRGVAGFGEQTDLKTRAAMLDEGLDLLVGLVGGERVTHQGTHYRADGVTLRPARCRRPGYRSGWVAAPRRRRCCAAPRAPTGSCRTSSPTPTAGRTSARTRCTTWWARCRQPAPTGSRSTWRSAAAVAGRTSTPSGRTWASWRRQGRPGGWSSSQPATRK
ncbi:LLM class flavin-dependent oxidoreductase [Micromonospora sp. ATA51]|uniref:LLM class flavin-dependent oxidoreductase n=1 Tax=Micromonospora sp. ATA51 TaxID=2806098 RepID=UPI001EE49B8E|nr:LLM class flavin-dependent oxidoreductase [Micromonospora sp. ATA51]